MGTSFFLLLYPYRHLARLLKDVFGQSIVQYSRRILVCEAASLQSDLVEPFFVNMEATRDSKPLDGLWSNNVAMWLTRKLTVQIRCCLLVFLGQLTHLD